MKFVVSSTELLNSLQAIGKVVSGKNTLPILDNFLFMLQNNQLTITGSDLESTLVATLDISHVEQEGSAAIPAKLLTDTLREFPEQPLNIYVDEESLMAEISWNTGKFNIPCYASEEYPQMTSLNEETINRIEVDSEMLAEGISKTIFAIGEDELRPVMNGICFDYKEDGLVFAASDSHKLVRYTLLNLKAENPCSFILPKRPAVLLKGILGKENIPMKIEFDDKHASFTGTRFKMTCRLIEGIFPAYNSVIPTNNLNKAVVDRVDLLTASRRVSNFSSQSSNLIKLKVSGNELIISAQDLDFSISATDKINCHYDGEDIEIGFKSSFLIEILSNLSSTNVSVELADSSRAGLFIPYENENENEDVLMLLMPMVIGV